MSSRFRIVPALLLAVALPASAQQTLTLAPVPTSSVEVDGTSNRSDWTVAAEEVTGRLTVAANDDGITVTAAEIRVASNSVKSDRGMIMDRLMKGALKVSQFPDISFVMTAEAPGVPADSGFAISAPGTLTIAGESREVELDVLASPVGDGSWRFRGAHPVVMTEYGMRPPTAMFGALVTGDEVTVRFDVIGTTE